MIIRITGLLILLTPCIVTDIRRRELPVGFILIFSMLAAAGNLIFRWIEVRDMLFGAILGILFLLAARFAKRGLGLGDGFLILGAGILCGGEFTVPLLLITFLLTFFGGGGYLLLARRNLRERLPLAPFMGLAGVGECIALMILAEAPYEVF